MSAGVFSKARQSVTDLERERERGEGERLQLSPCVVTSVASKSTSNLASLMQDDVTGVDIVASSPLTRRHVDKDGVEHASQRRELGSQRNTDILVTGLEPHEDQVVGAMVSSPGSTELPQ